jgi:signal transduction histidine kinase
MLEVRTLIVDDSRQDVDLMLLHLQREGVKVEHELVDSEPALKSALSRDWDVVICDFYLPGFDGIKAISMVKAERPDLPVLVVSGSVGEERAVESMRAGASDFILKASLARLMPAIERGMKERRFLTESRQIEAALKKTEEDLRQAQKLEAIGQLAGGIAHDFNNIIAAVLMQAEALLEDGGNGADIRKRVSDLEAGVRKIGEAAERAKSLTRQLLGFSRRQVLQPKVLSLNALISQMEAMLRPLVEESIEFRNSLASDLRNVKVDPSHIEQILLNLVVNSRDAMPQGGAISIATRNDSVDQKMAASYGVTAGPYALLEVSDTGTGLSPEAQKRLFEPFFTTKPMGKGTGLGLCTIYGIVKQNRGLIFVESELGAGTTFRIYFPQVEEAAEEARAPAPLPEKLSGTETILVVEDEMVLQEVICRSLRRQGYQILTATNGIEALSLIQSYAGEIHLVITDVVMPQMGGSELAAECFRLGKRLKFLFQSGYTEDTLVQNGIRSGQIHFLEKPYTSKILLAKVREIIG